MTEFLLVAENVTETEDADFVLYFGANLFLFQIMQIGPGLILCDLHSQGQRHHVGSPKLLPYINSERDEGKTM
jgi:hypothetical protein